MLTVSRAKYADCMSRAKYADCVSRAKYADCLSRAKYADSVSWSFTVSLCDSQHLFYHGRSSTTETHLC